MNSLEHPENAKPVVKEVFGRASPDHDGKFYMIERAGLFWNSLDTWHPEATKATPFVCEDHARALRDLIDKEADDIA